MIYLLILSLSLSLQVLELFAESGGFTVKLHEVHHKLALPPLPLHRGVCSARHAALRGPVSDF